MALRVVGGRDVRRSRWRWWPWVCAMAIPVGLWLKMFVPPLSKGQDMMRQLCGNCESGSGSVVVSTSECEGGVGRVLMGVGRERSNADRMIEMMVGVRVGSTMVMKASFSSMILVEGNAQKWMVVEMESGGMDELVRAEASVEKMFVPPL